MKKLLLACVLIVLAFNVFAKSMETWICLRNDTDVPQWIDAQVLDNHHWDGNSRPDKNFNNVYILPHDTLCNREEVNSNDHIITYAFMLAISEGAYTNKTTFDGKLKVMPIIRTNAKPNGVMLTMSTYKKWKWARASGSIIDNEIPSPEMSGIEESMRNKYYTFNGNEYYKNFDIHLGSNLAAFVGWDCSTFGINKTNCRLFKIYH